MEGVENEGLLRDWMETEDGRKGREKNLNGGQGNTIEMSGGDRGPKMKS